MHKYTHIFIASDPAKRRAPAVWLAAIMAKCHKTILAYHGAHRNHRDLSVLGLLSTFQSHVNSSLQVFFFVCQKRNLTASATCFVFLGCHESSYLATWTRAKCVRMIYRNCCDSAVMKTQLHVWQHVCTKAFLQEWFYFNFPRFSNASVIAWLLWNIWVEAALMILCLIFGKLWCDFFWLGNGNRYIPT